MLAEVAVAEGQVVPRNGVLREDAPAGPSQPPGADVDRVDPEAAGRQARVSSRVIAIEYGSSPPAQGRSGPAAATASGSRQPSRGGRAPGGTANGGSSRKNQLSGITTSSISACSSSSEPRTSRRGSRRGRARPSAAHPRAPRRGRSGRRRPSRVEPDPLGEQASIAARSPHHVARAFVPARRGRGCTVPAEERSTGATHRGSGRVDQLDHLAVGRDDRRRGRAPGGSCIGAEMTWLGLDRRHVADLLGDQAERRPPAPACWSSTRMIRVLEPIGGRAPSRAGAEVDHRHDLARDSRTARPGSRARAAAAAGSTRGTTSTTAPRPRRRRALRRLGTSGAAWRPSAGRGRRRSRPGRPARVRSPIRPTLPPRTAARLARESPRVNRETSSFRPPTASRRWSVALLNSRSETEVWFAPSLSRTHGLADLLGPLRLDPHPLGHLVEPLGQALHARR